MSVVRGLLLLRCGRGVSCSSVICSCSTHVAQSSRRRADFGPQDGSTSTPTSPSHISQLCRQFFIICQSTEALSLVIQACRAESGRSCFPWLQMSLKKLIKERILFSFSFSTEAVPVKAGITPAAMFAVFVLKKSYISWSGA